MTISALLSAAKQGPVDFKRTMQVIDDNFIFVPTAFKNGQVENAADTNNGSCKLFAFAKLQDLDEQTTLNLFGDFYTQDVLQNPEGEDHQNIRNFMQNGWSGIEFASQPLSAK